MSTAPTASLASRMRAVGEAISRQFIGKDEIIRLMCIAVDRPISPAPMIRISVFLAVIPYGPITPPQTNRDRLSSLSVSRTSKPVVITSDHL